MESERLTDGERIESIQTTIRELQADLDSYESGRLGYPVEDGSEQVADGSGESRPTEAGISGEQLASVSMQTGGFNGRFVSAVESAENRRQESQLRYILDVLARKRTQDEYAILTNPNIGPGEKRMRLTKWLMFSRGKEWSESILSNIEDKKERLREFIRQWRAEQERLEERVRQNTPPEDPDPLAPGYQTTDPDDYMFQIMADHIGIEREELKGRIDIQRDWRGRVTLNRRGGKAMGSAPVMMSNSKSEEVLDVTARALDAAFDAVAEVDEPMTPYVFESLLGTDDGAFIVNLYAEPAVNLVNTLEKIIARGPPKAPRKRKHNSHITAGLSVPAVSFGV